MANTKVFFINDIEKKTYTDFVELVYSHDGNILIVLESGGGTCPHMYGIVDLINAPENTDRISITAIGHIYSSAFELFISAKCKKTIVAPLIGMFHIMRFTGGSLLENGKPIISTEDEVLMDNYKEIRHRSQKIIDAAGFTPKQVKEFWKGHDFYFTTSEIEKIIENYKH